MISNILNHFSFSIVLVIVFIQFCIICYSYTSAHGSGQRYYILLLKFLSFFSFFSPPDLRDGSTDREPF